MAAVHTGRQRREEERRDQASYLAALEHEEVADIARQALPEVARVPAGNADLREELAVRRASSTAPVRATWRPGARPAALHDMTDGERMRAIRGVMDGAGFLNQPVQRSARFRR